MRFIRGPIPEEANFHPETEGWRGIREPDPVWMQVIAIPIMLVTGALISLVIVRWTVIPWKIGLAYLAPAFLFMIPVHELLHAFANPRFGFTERTYVGFWPSRLLFYAHYEGALSRERFLVILAAPTIVLTVLPLLACVVFRLHAPPLAALALANGLGAAGDLLGILIVLTQIPRKTLVRNKGWRSYWREKAVAESP